MALIKSKLSKLKMAEGGQVPTETYAQRLQRGFLGQKKAEGGFVEDQPLPEMPEMDTDADSDKVIPAQHVHILGMILDGLRKRKA
jgi:hypothetical protein